MILLVDFNTRMILERCDAWELGGESRLLKWAEDNGYKVLGRNITMKGDMVIWVE